MKSIINWYITSDMKLKGDVFKFDVYEYMDNIKPSSAMKKSNGYIIKFKITNRRDGLIDDEDVVSVNQEFELLTDKVDKWHTKNIKNYSLRIEKFFSKYIN